MRSLARIAAGLVVAAVPIALSGSSSAHAATRVDSLCTGSMTMTFNPFLTTVYNGPYGRTYGGTCDAVDLLNPPGVQVVPNIPYGSSLTGNASGTCAAAVLTGDFRGGVGVLIGGSVVVAGSAIPLTGDVAFTEVAVLVPTEIPCLSETSATGPSIDNTVL